MSLTYPQIQALMWLDSFEPQSKGDCNQMGHTQRVLAALQVKGMLKASGEGKSQMLYLTPLGSMYVHNLRALCDIHLSKITDRTGDARAAYIVRLGKSVAKGLAL